jgi:hypothetical protein
VGSSPDRVKTKTKKLVFVASPHSAIFQLYHGDNKLIFIEMMMMSALYALDFNSASSLKQQSMGRHVVPLRHIILIPSQPVLDIIIISMKINLLSP